MTAARRCPPFHFKGTMMKRIMVIGTGGTIACTAKNCIQLDAPFKVLDSVQFDDIAFECFSPFSILSENIGLHHWEILVQYLENFDFSDYLGVIILHGSDTLAYTAAIIGNLFYDKRIVLTASDKPIEDKSANGIANFRNAVLQLEKSEGVFVSYDGIHNPLAITSADSRDKFVDIEKHRPPCGKAKLQNRNILVLPCLPNTNYGNYMLGGVDLVLHEMYHSATAPENVTAFIKSCKKRGIPFYFVTAKNSADYESAKDFENILFNSTLEDAYAKALLGVI